MDRADVLALARRSADPAVTILVPVVQPGARSEELRLTLAALEERAVAATSTWWGDDAGEAVQHQLAGLDARIPPERGCRGLAVLVTPADARVEHLPFAVPEEVVVDTTFATRPLLEGLARSSEHWIVLVDGTGARLLSGSEAGVHEVRSATFPIRTGRRAVEAPHRDRPVHEHVDDADLRATARRVDEGLATLLAAEARPVVLAGATGTVDVVAEVCRRTGSVAAVLHLDPPGEDLEGLAAAASAAVADHRRTRRRHAVDRLLDSVGPGRAVTGLPRVVEAASAGRVRELVVEEGFSMPRRWVDGLDDRGSPDPALDTEDVVDDLIEDVLREGGDVTFVDPDQLDEGGHVGALLRW